MTTTHSKAIEEIRYQFSMREVLATDSMCELALAKLLDAADRVAIEGGSGGGAIQPVGII
jgi:hypothetical protein